MSPFFSVCIPLYNREKTIYNTLSSLSRQSFNNFNVKIVIYKCDDDTDGQVSLFFKSEIFKKNPFDHEIKYSDLNFDDWNGPVLLADGKYIAMLEGDDQFLPEHLNTAHSILSVKDNIGIYATGNQHRFREKFGIIKSNI
jgi:GT2 family glycosyltransferase